MAEKIKEVRLDELYPFPNEGVIYGLNTGKARNIKEFAA